MAPILSAKGLWWRTLLVCVGLLLLPCLVVGAMAAKRHIVVTVQGAIPQTPAHLSLYFMGDELKRFEAEVDSSGRYHFHLESITSGYYRFVFGDKEFTLTFPLFNQEPEIALTTSAEAPLDSARITGAPEAEAYFTLLREHSLLEDAEWGLKALEASLGKENQTLAQIRQQVEKRFYQAVMPIVDASERLYPAGTVTLYYMPTEGRKGFEKWFTEDWFTYPLVTFDPAFTNYMRRFFEHYRSATYSYTQQLTVYADLLRQLSALKRSELNEIVLRTTLIDIFKGTVYDGLLDSMGRYGLLGGLDTVYHAERREPERLLKMKRKDVTGKAVAMVDKKAAYTLVVLWSDHCAHCQALMPRLWEVCQSIPAQQLAVRAISIDKDTPERRDYIAQRGWGWTNLIEHDDGESELLEALNGDGTPALFLLDKRGHLVARPENETQLKNELRELGDDK